MPSRISLQADDLWGRIAWGFSWERDHAGVKPEIEHILAQPNFFEVLSERALPALPWIVSEIERLDLPMELALIPVIESMLDPGPTQEPACGGTVANQSCDRQPLRAGG